MSCEDAEHWSGNDLQYSTRGYADRCLDFLIFQTKPISSSLLRRSSDNVSLAVRCLLTLVLDYDRRPF